MIITVKELENNLDKYLHLSETEDVFVLENDRIVCKLTNAYQEKIALVESLVGIVPVDADIDEGKNERLKSLIDC